MAVPEEVLGIKLRLGAAHAGTHLLRPGRCLQLRRLLQHLDHSGVAQRVGLNPGKVKELGNALIM